MSDLAAERLAVTAARLALEAALRTLRTAEAHADFHRDAEGAFPEVSEASDPELFAEIAMLQPDLEAGTAGVNEAQAALDRALDAYRRAAQQAPLFATENADPLLLLPVRVEAIYFDDEGTPELRIRVYPDDVHVDSHETALTETERLASTVYWRADRAAGNDSGQRQAAWQALVGAVGGARAAWVREALTPLDDGAGEPRFPDVELRPQAWTRAAHTQLLPDRFAFSAYRKGKLVWRHEGAPIPDTLPIGIAPQAGKDEAEGDVPAYDAASQWLADFKLAKDNGMALAVKLDSAGERFDLITVVGVGGQDAATGAARVDAMLTAHAYSGGLTPLPVGTPTNNTPDTRSGWRSREAPPNPEVVARRRAAYKPESDQEAARLARALGVDGSGVLAAVCDPGGGAESLLRRLHKVQAAEYANSPGFRPAERNPDLSTPVDAPWYAAVADHYTRFVRARGPLPPLRIGRQPYGVLPVSALDLWRGDDVDERISRFTASFLASFVEQVARAPQIGEGPDQDALLLDLLSREASPGALVSRSDFTVDVMEERPPPAAVGALPASAALAWLHPPVPPAEGESDGLASRIEPFPETVPESVQQIAIDHPLAEMLVLFDESLKTMRERHTAPDPAGFAAKYAPLRERLDQLAAAPTVSLFYAQASGWHNALGQILASGPVVPDAVAKAAAEGMLARNHFALYVPFEDDASADLSRFERLFRETIEPLSHRIDAWVTSLATARLAALRKERPAGTHTGAYGWLTDVEPTDPNPSREGFVVTPSIQHATTAAVLRSGWQAHSDKKAFAVDIQSARVRRAQAMVEGVRAGQSVGALLGYQFERALHDAKLDRFVAGFRNAYPLAPLVDPAAPDTEQAQVSIGARNVVDGQALRRDRSKLDDGDALAAAAGAALGDDAPALRRMLAELDETFDAVGDLLLAESVHHLVGGNPLRAGLAADAVGRGQDLPLDFDVLRTPRGGIGVTHHVGILLPDTPPRGWPDHRPLVELEPRLEAWARHRLGPASAWRLGDLDWCALEVVVAPPAVLRAATTDMLDDDHLAVLARVCERLRGALAVATPLTPAHLDPADPAPITGSDLPELRGRVAPWLKAVADAASDVAKAKTAEAAQPVLQRLGALGIPVGLAGAGDLERVRALLGDADLGPLPAPPDAAKHPADAADWLAAVLATTGRLLHPAVKIVPKLTLTLPPAPEPAPADDEVEAWLRDMTLVRANVDALDGAGVASQVLAGTEPAATAVLQSLVGGEQARPWVATAPPVEGPRPALSLVLQRDAKSDGPCGLVVDSWTEVVPRPPGKNGPEEVVGVAFDFDRPGARAPQVLLLAVPPDPERGWCAEDVHACVEEALLLARVRTLDLDDLPELRSVLPIPTPG